MGGWDGVPGLKMCCHKVATAWRICALGCKPCMLMDIANIQAVLTEPHAQSMTITTLSTYRVRMQVGGVASCCKR